MNTTAILKMIKDAIEEYISNDEKALYCEEDGDTPIFHKFIKNNDELYKYILDQLLVWYDEEEYIIKTIENWEIEHTSIGTDIYDSENGDLFRIAEFF